MTPDSQAASYFNSEGGNAIDNTMHNLPTHAYAPHVQHDNGLFLGYFSAQ